MKIGLLVSGGYQHHLRHSLLEEGSDWVNVHIVFFGCFDDQVDCALQQLEFCVFFLVGVILLDEIVLVVNGFEEVPEVN